MNESIDVENYNVRNVLVVGDGGVGKTTLINRLKGESFSPKYSPTSSYDITEIINHNMQTKFVFYDIAGQEKYENYIESIIRNTTIHFVIYMFDATSKLSHRSLNSWMNKISNLCSTIPYTILCNKIDCQTIKVREHNLISCKNDSLDNIFEIINNIEE